MSIFFYYKDTPEKDGNIRATHKNIYKKVYQLLVQLIPAGCSDLSPLNCRVETPTLLLLFPFSQNKGASIKCSVSLVPDMTGDLCSC